MIKLILKTSLVFCLVSSSSFRPFLLRNYSSTSELANKTLSPSPGSSNKNLSAKLPEKTLNNLSPIKIYKSYHRTKKIKMADDLTGQGGIVLFYSKSTSLYAIEGSGNLAGYFKDLFNKEMLKLLANIKIPKARQKKLKFSLRLIIKNY